MIIVTATFTFATQADRDRVAELSTPVQAAVRADELGCHEYWVAADPAVPTHIRAYERWEDAASIAAHLNHPNYAKMVEVFRTTGGFISATNRMYAAEDRGAVFDTQGRFRSEVV